MHACVCVMYICDVYIQYVGMHVCMCACAGLCASNVCVTS